MRHTTTKPESGNESSAKRIVMIDDQASYTEGLAQAFDLGGELEVVGRETSATNGVDVALDLHPDLVLCDYRIPGERNGIECAAQLRENGYRGEIVILTGFAASQVHSEAALLDDVRVISKDLPLGDIIEHVSTVRVETSVAPASRWNLDDYILDEIALSESADDGTPTRSRKIIIATTVAAAALTAGFLLLSGPGQPVTTPVETGLERPFVMVDGTAGQVRVSVEVDGVPSESFIPSNLPITVAVDAVAPNTNVQVLVEHLDDSGTASCSIGAFNQVLMSSSTPSQANAVCEAIIE